MVFKRELVEVVRKNEWGRERFYPANDYTHKLRELLGYKTSTKSFSRQQLEWLVKGGMTVKLVEDKSHLSKF